MNTVLQKWELLTTLSWCRTQTLTELGEAVLVYTKWEAQLQTHFVKTGSST